MSKKILGIDLGGTSVKFAIISSEGEIQEKWTIGTNILEDGKHIVPSIIQSIQEHMERQSLQISKQQNLSGLHDPKDLEKLAPELSVYHLQVCTQLRHGQTHERSIL